MIHFRTIVTSKSGLYADVTSWTDGGFVPRIGEKMKVGELVCVVLDIIWDIRTFTVTVVTT